MKYKKELEALKKVDESNLKVCGNCQDCDACSFWKNSLESYEEGGQNMLDDVLEILKKEFKDDTWGEKVIKHLKEKLR